MDFFAEQEQAQKRTRSLAWLFAIAVGGVLSSLYALGMGIGVAAGAESFGAQILVGRYPEPLDLPRLSWWQSTFGWGSVALGMLTITLGATYKTFQLRAGGTVIAHSMGAKRVDPMSTDFHERRFLNVVEEMSIASGIPCPDLYVLDEKGINAFAAGITLSDVVVGVTKGCLEQLNREELQSVVAHEFSHILNGDMRVNMRAVGLLHGVFVVALLGRLLLRSGGRDREGNSFALVGAVVLAIGSVGVFFGRMIQSAISHQREFLADASAVQFTRQTSGLANALKKIGGILPQGYVSAPSADESSHMFFSEAIRRFKPFATMFRTHPPLADRISKLEPGWDGEFIESLGSGDGRPPSTHSTPVPPGMSQLTPASVETGISHIGEPTPNEVSYAGVLHAAMPIDVRDALHRKEEAQALMFGLLLGGDSVHRDEASAMLAQLTDASTQKKALHFNSTFAALPSVEKIAAIDLALPALRTMSHDEYKNFANVIAALTRVDGRVDIFEFTLGHIIRRHLALNFDSRRLSEVRFRHLKILMDDAAIVLSVLANLGGGSESDAKSAFFAGIDTLSFPKAEFSASANVSAFEKALKHFDHATLQIKRNLMYACAVVVIHDGKVVDREAELIRAIGDAMGVPVPPFVGRL